MDYLWIIVMFVSTIWTLILTAPIHCILNVLDCILGLPDGEYIFSKFSFLGYVVRNVMMMKVANVSTVTSAVFNEPHVLIIC